MSFAEESLLDIAIGVVLSSHYPASTWSLHGYREEAACIEKTETGWAAYMGERGNRFEYAEFGSKEEACFHLFRLLTSSRDMIRKLSAELLETVSRYSRSAKSEYELADLENSGNNP